MRISLLPSIVKNIKDNTGKRDELKFFEVSKVYYPHIKNPADDSCPPDSATEGLPTEVWKLAVGTNTSFEDVKGIMEALLRELKITKYEMRPGTVDLFSKSMQVDFIVDGKTIGTVGKLSPPFQEKNGLKLPAYLAGFDLQSLIDHAKLLPEYMQINPYATIKLDLTIENPHLSYADMVACAKATSNLLQEVEFVGKFKSNITVRFYFSSPEKNITDIEAQADLEKIKKIVA